MNQDFRKPYQDRDRQGGGRPYYEGRSFPDIPFDLTEDPPEKFNESAEQWGRRWSKLEADVPPSQIRNFFTEVRRLEQLIDAHGWDANKLEFKLLKAKAAYILRDKPQQRKHLVKFIQEAADKVGSKNFKTFVKYFEAAVGYAYGYGFSKEKN
jgi:CRISPR type III-A-associated protein Csm2